MTVLHDITVNGADLATCCQRYGAARLWLFGSILRDDFRADSDVDVLVEVQQPIGLFRLGGLQSELEEVFGRPVHLTTLGSVPDAMRPDLLRGARLLYGA